MTEPTAQGDTSVLTAFFKHNAWANRTLLEFCAGLSDEQLDSTGVGGYGSIRDTLLHFMRGEMGYVSSGKGRPRPAPPTWDAGIDALQATARQASDELRELAIAAREDSIVRRPHPDQGVEEYPLASLMVQAITHSTEHRTQIAAIITQLGLEPPDMSAWAYMEETGEFKIVAAEGTA